MLRHLEHRLGILCLLFLVGHTQAAYSALPRYAKLPFFSLPVKHINPGDGWDRWGQAVAIVDDALFVFGGKTDQYNQFSYLSAPWNDDLLFLSLSSSFDPTSPPWQYISGSQNSSTPDGPELAWHTLSVFNQSYALVFGGNSGPLSEQQLMDRSDSALLLNIYNRLAPTWVNESEGWAGEPQRRVRHSASSTGGKIWIVGGERADGSSNGFSDHYVFDPSSPSFTQLPSTNAPTDIYGHASIVLQDGRLIVFGGYSQSEGRLNSFGTIWALDTTQSNLVWATVEVDNSSLPSSRMAFASVILYDGRVIIHGGTDSGFQNNFSDGWILDTSKSPMVWSSVDVLSGLGGRRDHFAVCAGNQVIFGFGYSSSGPADANLHIFDVDSGDFSTSFTPSTGAPAHQTLPAPTQTGAGDPSHTNTASSPGYTGSDPSGTGGSHHSAGLTGTATGPDGRPTSTQGNGGGGGNNGNGNGNGDSPDSGGSHTSKATAIAVGTILGVLGFIVGASAAVYYARRRAQHRALAFHPLGTTDDEENPHGVTAIPMAGAQEKGRVLFPAVLGAVGLGCVWRQQGRERRDMFADEDRSFGSSQWRHVSREESGSSWSAAGSGRSSRARNIAEVVTGSWASLRALGGHGTRSREPTHGSAEWNEKNPFSDEVGLMSGDPADEEDTPDRPRGGWASSSSSGTVRTNRDPFEDRDLEVLHDAGSDDGSEPGSLRAVGVISKPPHASLRTALPSTVDFVPMSPLIEQASRNSLSGSSSSHIVSSSHYDSSRSSNDMSVRRPTSIIDANPSPSQPMRRSNSWWARFARTPLLDRLSGDASSGSTSGRSTFLDFRDPNPPPRLITIEESQHSNMSDSPEFKKLRAASGSGSQDETFVGSGGVARRASLYGAARHAKSVSSLQTANTETLERAEGSMAIVQRDSTIDSQTTTSAALGDDFGNAGPSTPPLALVRQTSEAESAEVSFVTPVYATSPTDAQGHMDVTGHGEQASILDRPLPMAVPPSPTRRISTAGVSGVASRIQAYERRLSRGAEGPLPPTNTWQREERSSPRPVVRYGLVPKPSLFVANPDRRDGPSSDTL